MANAVRWAVANGNWSNPATWNNGGVLGIPDSDGTDLVYTNGFTVNVDQNINVALLSNAARARDIATPQMTANNAPSPFVAAASNGSSPFLAFNRNYNSGTDYWQTVAPVITGWLSMDLFNPTVIDGYTIWGSDNSSVNPSGWNFQGSLDGVSWTTLHSISGNPIGGSSSYSVFSIGNTTAYRFYRLDITGVNGGNVIRITEFGLHQSGTAAIASGGSFNFNTGGVVATVTTISAAATNLITITATTGLVTINTNNNVNGIGASTQIFNHTGNCDFTISGTNFIGGIANSGYCFNKSSTGTITITGNLLSGPTGSGVVCLFSTNGNTIVYGNVTAHPLNTGGASHGIQQSLGNVTVYGNVSGGGIAGSNVGILLSGATSILTIVGNISGGTSNGSAGVSHSGASSTINVTGNIYGGTASNTRGITASSLTINVVGNIYGGILNPALECNGTLNITGNIFAHTSQNAIIGTNTILNITGDVYASALANAINLTTGTVILNGNMYNTLGRNAIWCPNLFISDSSTTKWVMDIGGGATKTLYSADTFPNLPLPSDVEDGVLYGPSSSLLGTMKVPIPADVRRNVPVGNTVGTFTAMSAQDIINYISSSPDDLAKRLREILTIDQTNNIV